MLIFSPAQQEKYDREISATWQRRLYHIEQKSTQPQLYLEKIENFNTTYPNWPFALVRLGRAYLLLEDLQGALEQFETALRLLSPVKFARYVEGLSIKVTILPFRNAWLIGGFMLEH